MDWTVMKKEYNTPHIEFCRLFSTNVLWGGSTKPEPKAPGRGEGSSVKLTTMYV